MDSNIKVIALYLPQYHPTPNNDKWWGKGFTEWTNVGKAKPLFKGHEQPKVPADLGYYDLRLPETREAQAKMAKEAGIYGFCYYHYWFGNGQQELELPFNEVIKLGKPDFPFCLCWANESWHKKFWNIDGTYEKEILAKQIYENAEGHTKHFYQLLPAFKDNRYIKIDGKLLFMIYKPLDFEDVEDFMTLWNNLAKKNGLKGFHFVGQTRGDATIKEIVNKGFNAVSIIRLNEIVKGQFKKHTFKGFFRLLYKKISSRPFIVNYNYAIKKLTGNEEKEENNYPTIIPNWDHTPRSNKGGWLLNNVTPDLFKQHLKIVFETVNNKRSENKIVFLKSWNEWGEGNYIEPDLIHGNMFLKIFKETIRQYNSRSYLMRISS